MRRIISGAYTDYIFLFGDSRTSFSDHAARNSAASGGNIFIMLDDGSPCGYLCTVQEENEARLMYAYTNTEKRRSGVFSALVEYAAETLPRPIKFNISAEHRSYDTAVRICKEAGFEFLSSCTVFKGTDISGWEKYMSGSGGKLCDMLKRRGYTCVSFADAPDNLIDEIYNSHENSFGNRLAVKAFFDNPQKMMNMDMSFAAVRDNSLAAYTLVTSPDRSSAVFEHISASEKEIGSGCILLPFSCSMEKFRQFNCRRAAYAMYGDNEHANAFRMKLLQCVTSSSSRSENYILKKRRYFYG